MLVIAGTIKIQPEDRTVAVAAMTTMMVETAKEAGCISYVFSADLSNDTTFHLFEEWESQADLDSHFETPHMVVFREALSSIGERTTDIKRYVVEESGPLGG